MRNYADKLYACSLRVAIESPGRSKVPIASNTWKGVETAAAAARSIPIKMKRNIFQNILRFFSLEMNLKQIIAGLDDNFIGVSTYIS